MEKRIKKRNTEPQFHSVEEILRWIKLKNRIDDTGHELTWRDVSEITGVGVDVLKNIVTQFKKGKRKNEFERRAEMRRRIQKEVDAGKTSMQIARKLQMQKHTLLRHLRLMGYQLEDWADRGKPVNQRK